MKKLTKGGFINIGGVPYKTKTTYGIHMVYLTRVMPCERIEIKFVHNDEYRVVEIDDSELTLEEY